MTDSAASTPVTARYEGKRQLILDEAATLFNDKGLKGATLADVARRIGLTTTSVSYYFRRRDDLAAACFFQTIAAFNDLLDQAEAVAAGEGRLRRFVGLHLGRLAAISRRERPDLITFSDLSALTGDQASKVFDAFIDLFRRTRSVLFEELSEALPRRELNARTHLFMSAVFGIRSWASDYELSDLVRLGDDIVDILTRGVSHGDGAWPPQPLEFAPLAHDRRGEQREAFLRAATQLINEQGYHGASVTRISARLGVTKGSFYHHQDTKDDLVTRCFERSFLIQGGAQDAAFSVVGTGWDRLSSVASSLVRYQLSEQGPLLRYTAFAAAPEAVRSDLEATADRLGRRYTLMLAQGAVDGSLKVVNQGLAAHLLDGMINAAAELWRWTPALDQNLVVDAYVRPMLMGLYIPSEPVA